MRRNTLRLYTPFQTNTHQKKRIAKSTIRFFSSFSSPLRGTDREWAFNLTREHAPLLPLIRYQNLNHSLNTIAEIAYQIHSRRQWQFYSIRWRIRRNCCFKQQSAGYGVNAHIVAFCGIGKFTVPTTLKSLNLFREV